VAVYPPGIRFSPVCVPASPGTRSTTLAQGLPHAGQQPHSLVPARMAKAGMAAGYTA